MLMNSSTVLCMSIFTFTVVISASGIEVGSSAVVWKWLVDHEDREYGDVPLLLPGVNYNDLAVPVAAVLDDFCGHVTLMAAGNYALTLRRPETTFCAALLLAQADYAIIELQESSTEYGDCNDEYLYIADETGAQFAYCGNLTNPKPRFAKQLLIQYEKMQHLTQNAPVVVEFSVKELSPEFEEPKDLRSYRSSQGLIGLKELCPHSCGKTQRENRVGRIIGGQNVLEGEHPWQARIRVILSNHTVSFCGGAILDKRTVITAAHCLIKKDLSIQWVDVLVGDTHKSHIHGQILRAVNWEVHGGHKAGDPKDIALIKTNIDMQFGRAVQPICLGSDTDYSGHIAVATGFGRNSADPELEESDILQKVPVVILSKQRCIDIYYKEHISISDTEMCGAGLRLGGTCYGDSGGPLVINLSGVHRLIGLTSFGKDECGKKHFPDVYTKVSSYRDWILEGIDHPTC